MMPAADDSPPPAQLKDWFNEARYRSLAAQLKALAAGFDEDLFLKQTLEGLEARHQRTSVILTGRDAKPEICDYADLVTEMGAVKHPIQAGIKAQRGIDF